ncbi:hypothetical protein G4B88_014903 [Cannabis sativa]|uniref:Uncharacterized protein n=1 Tax=Cannabis sativa TaxID=3483 RepID=A0A7J6IA80_CANSA|nr:hypothetical protein G4B88_014903 [Cannabis sativa]
MSHGGPAVGEGGGGVFESIGPEIRVTNSYLSCKGYIERSRRRGRIETLKIKILFNRSLGSKNYEPENQTNE